MEPGRQLAMFVTPREIRENYGPNDRKPGEVSDSRIWNRKLRESKETGNGRAIPMGRNEFGDYKMASLHDHIAANGVSKPVYLGTEDAKVYDGHHRVASAYASRPDDLMPVLHATSPGDAFEHRAQQKYGTRRTRRGAA